MENNGRVGSHHNLMFKDVKMRLWSGKWGEIIPFQTADDPFVGIDYFTITGIINIMLKT